jgi:hypothetical protein
MTWQIQLMWRTTKTGRLKIGLPNGTWARSRIEKKP